jgi:hypothetical protein
MDTTQTSWLDVVDHSMGSLFAWLNRPQVTTTATGQNPYGQPSASDMQLAALNAQLQANQANQKTMLMVAGAAVAVYLLTR